MDGVTEEMMEGGGEVPATAEASLSFEDETASPIAPSQQGSVHSVKNLPEMAADDEQAETSYEDDTAREQTISEMEQESDTEKEDWFDAFSENKDLDEFLSQIDKSEDHVPLPAAQEVHEVYQPKITTLRTEMETAPLPKYLDEFEDTIKDDVVMLASVSINDIQQEELRLREEHVAYNKHLAEQQQQLKKEIAQREELAKERLLSDLRKNRQEIERKEQELARAERLAHENLKKAFVKSEGQLKSALRRRKGEVNAFYGELAFADEQYGGSKGKRWRVEWTKTPQPIQIKLKCVRGLRDKIPMGRYVIMVSLYDRLGGHVRRWSRLTGQQWGGSTLPVNHDGKYSSAQLTLDQSVFTVVPSKDEVRPGMMLIFELFLLRGSVTPTDRVVAWAAFPICDGQFEIVQGYYKAPMLRGHMDMRIDRHSIIEELIASDLDHWLANIYFQIVRLPRYLSGQKEYEVELQFSSGLLSYPDRILEAEEAVDGEEIPDRADYVSTFGTESVRSESQLSLHGIEEKIFKTSSISSSSGIHTGEHSSSQDSLNKVPLDDGVRYRGGRSARSSQRSHKRGKHGMHLSKKSGKGSSSSSSDQESDEDSVISSKLKGEFTAVPDQPGMYCKVHTQNPVEDYNAKRAALMVPQPIVASTKKPKPKLTYLEQLERHTFAVQPPFSTKGRLERTGHERADYVRRMFLAEMGFSQWRTREFWTTMLMLALLWFVRLYVHYCGQWLFLQAISIPVNSFIFYPYTVELNYQSDLLKTSESIAIVVLGPISDIIVLVLFVLISWLSQATLGTFPLLFSKFIMAFALWTVMDPIAILIVDSALGRYQFSASQPIGDSFKLYWHFLRVQGSGALGIPLTIYLYIILMFTAIVILYLYFLKLHNNGRMLDVFHRLHGEEGVFFVPFDLEVSIQELGYIVKKAEQWRGADGERRKVTVYDYIWGEETELGDETTVRKEITTHIAVHTLHLDGLRELYRHFLRLPNGAIVEILGELGTTKLIPDVKTALLKRANSVENFFDTNHSNSRAPPSTAGAVSIQDLTEQNEGFSKSMLGIPAQIYGKQEDNERPATSETLKTRNTIINRESTSSMEGQDLDQSGATLQIPVQDATEA